MEFIDFSTALNDLFLYFGNTPPKDDRKRVIYDGVKNIPGIALESIMGHIKKESDTTYPGISERPLPWGGGFTGQDIRKRSGNLKPNHAMNVSEMEF